HHGIAADYYISDGGACVLDKQGTVVAEGILPKITLHTLMQAIEGNPFLQQALASSIHLDAENQTMRYESWELRHEVDLNAMVSHPINKLVLRFSEPATCTAFREQIARTLPDLVIHEHHSTLTISAQVEDHDLHNALCQQLYHAYRSTTKVPFVYEQ
ncbi:MAG: hypothetical protein ACRDBX_08000, partial [Erysipelotrichaceae bacterium]